MGHAHHFLSRLDRVSLPHVELALGLYRDHELLAYVLHRARLPEGAERVAISLDDPRRGPFLVVTRDGRFVTCLGHGMEIGDLPVVPRAKLDASSGSAEVLRARLAAARDAAQAGGGAIKLLRRLHEAADELPREELVTISALQPLYGFELLRLLIAVGADVIDAREALTRHLRRSDKLKPKLRPVLLAYWRSVWAVGHLTLLAAMSGPALLEISAPMTEKLHEMSFSWSAVRQGVMPLALKGAWGVARVGKGMFADCKRRYAEAATLLTAVDAALGVAALGMRHAKLRAEAQKVFAVPPAGDPERRSFIEVLRRAIGASLGVNFEDGDVAALAHRRFGAEVWLKWCKDLPAGDPLRFDRWEDVPEDLARTAAVNLPVSFVSDRTFLMWMFLCVPWVARAAPEQLYLSRAELRVIHVPWTPEATLTMLRPLRDHYHAPAPPTKPAGPTRQGPCPCGSGKKYKRCCEGKE